MSIDIYSQQIIDNILI